ncbi:MAG TPA: hypothetical protein DCZ72_12645 [Armatimonadetes bacterium]|nr:hypothetical protein [Armatimonadota bacterium]
MAQQVELTVWLKIPDMTALTARRTLQQRMGYGEQLADLTRTDWWRMELDVADEAAALALGEELAGRTTVFVNPNKHGYRVATTASPRERHPELTPVSVVTGFKGDPRATLTLEALQGRLGYGDRVRDLALGTFWTFWLREPDLAAAQALAQQMTLRTDRGTGLLVNPHSMWWRLAG